MIKMSVLRNSVGLPRRSPRLAPRNDAIEVKKTKAVKFASFVSYT